MRRGGILSRRSRPNRWVDRESRAQRRRARLRVARLGVLLLVTGVAGYHLVRLAAGKGWLSPFQIREVRVVGAEVTHPGVLVAEAGLVGERLHLWSSLGEYSARVARDPMIVDARFRRRFPNRLVLEVTERRPVALVDVGRAAPVDSTGRILPVSGFRDGWDVPVVATDWPPAELGVRGTIANPTVKAALAWLGAVERAYPALYREISAVDIDRDGTRTVRLIHAEAVLVLDPSTPLEKLALVDDVLYDLRAKGIEHERLDLRFEGQIVVRRG